MKILLQLYMMQYVCPDADHNLCHAETDNSSDIQFIAQFIVNQINSETFHQINIYKYIYIPLVGCIWEASRV